MHRVRSLLALVLASTLTAVGLVVASPGIATGLPVGQAAPDCTAFNDPVYRIVKPTNNASLLTTSRREADGAAAYGFTDDQGEVFKASTRPATGLVEVHRLFRAVRPDFMVTADPPEWQNPIGALLGYDDDGISFYASPVAADCLSPIYQYTKDTRHRVAGDKADRDALVAAGWVSQGIVFYAAVDTGSEPAPPEPPDDGDTVFTFAAIPDTQQEVLRSSDTRFLNRTKWLVNQKSALDLRFATQTGDLVNWDTPEHDQYEIASAGMKPLEAADIPYTIAIGNHDTMATGVGGGARDARMTRIYQRDTRTFNSYFTASRYTEVGGAFESGKVDNLYSLYEAGGVKWMVLVLELWPRKAAVDWAKNAVASHPDHNVIMVTHDYLDGAGGLGQSANYGDTSPQYLWDNLISQYPNIKMTFSGHVGWATDRVYTGKNGNKIYSFLTTIHSMTTNPVRLLTVNTATGTLKTWIYAPFTNETYSAHTKTITGVSLVR
jgi:hypothetical protein